MIRVTLNPIPDAHCSVPFLVTACVVTDVGGPVRICARIAPGGPCRLARENPGPGPEPDGEECAVIVATGNIDDRECATIPLTVVCPGLNGGATITVIVTATNANGESDADSRGVHITCP